MTGAQEKVREWSARFRQCPLAAEVVAGLDKRASEIWRRTFDLLQLESPEYRNAVDEQFTSESKGHCKELLDTIVSIATGRRTRGSTGADPFAFVRTHAEWRARHQVPLVASLHAYRLAHKTYGGITRDLLLQHPERGQALLAMAMLADFWIEFFDHIGFVLADAHAAEVGQSVAQDTRAYNALIENLLRGVEQTDPEACRLRTLCGIRPGALLAVAVARPFRSAGGDPIDVAPALRSLERLIQQELPSATFGKLVAMCDGDVIALVCSQASPARGLVKVLKRIGRRTEVASGVGIGVSRDAHEVSELPNALEEAQLALEFVTPTHPILRFDEIELTEFLIRRAERSALRLIPEWATRLAGREGPQAREFAKTIRVFADCSLNVKETARRLNLHPNTVYFRLNQIQNLTGTNPRTFAGLSLLLTALRLLQSQQQGKPTGA